MASSNSDPEQKLEQSITLLDAVAIEVGAIVGAGLFSVTGVATGIAGPAVSLAFFVAFAIVVFSLIPTAIMGAIIPVEGGNYRYASRFFSPTIAFLAVWGLAVGMLGGGVPLYAVTFGEYLQDLVSDDSFFSLLNHADPYVSGLIFLTIFYVVNLLGIEWASRLQVFLFIALCGSILIFIGFGVPNIDGAQFDPFFATGYKKFLIGSAMLYFVCIGANFMVDLGGEVSEAAATIPMSFVISISLVLFIYVMTAVVSVGTVGWTAMDGEMLSVPAKQFLSPALSTAFIVGGAMFALATTINAVFMIAPKYLMVLAEDKVFPEFIGRVNNTFGTPHWAITIIYAISACFILARLNLDRLSSLFGFGSMFLIIPVMLGILNYASENPTTFKREAFGFSIGTVKALCILAVICNILLIGLLAFQYSTVFLAWFITLGFGILYFGIRQSYLTEKGINLLEEMRRSLDEHRVDT